MRKGKRQILSGVFFVLEIVCFFLCLFLPGHSFRHIFIVKVCFAVCTGTGTGKGDVMGLFFGNGGIFTRVGNLMYSSGQDNDNDVMSDVGNMTYGRNGNTMSTIGDVSYLSNGNTITHAGSQYYVNGKTYTKTGNMLYGPDGKTWSGSGMSDRDVRNIIMHDNT